MITMPNDRRKFVDAISTLVLSDSSKHSDFPLKIKVHVPQDARELKNHLTATGIAWNSSHNEVELLLVEKSASDAIVVYLVSHKYLPQFDYSQFAIHPGMLYVKGIHRGEDEVREYFNKLSRFHLLTEVYVDGQGAVLRFDNYIDADVVARSKLPSSPFGKSLQVLRYKKEHDIRPPEPVSDDSIVYDTIVVENFCDLAGTMSLDQLQTILNKFELFLPVSAVFFPVFKDGDRVHFKQVGFIGFASGKDISTHLLRALYYLNDKTLPELLAFSSDSIYDLAHDVNVPESASSGKEPRMKLSIAQRKHNHHLFETDFHVELKDGSLTISHSDESLASRFYKSTNYQETNVYVNNFPIMFENDDVLWAQFWNQFGVGRVKSAKIIKPQFYRNKPNAALGKIGFVFYEEFRMALRAIILTNNKVVRYQSGPAILIQASFAIQKHTHQPQKQKFHGYNYTESESKYLTYGPVPLFIPLEYVPKYMPQITQERVTPPEYMVPYMVSMPYMERPDEEFCRNNVLASYPPFGFYYPFLPHSQMPMNPMIPPRDGERKKSA